MTVSSTNTLESTVRLGVIGAVFLSVTLALVLLQPSGEDVATPMAEDASDADTVARAKTSFSSP